MAESDYGDGILCGAAGGNHTDNHRVRRFLRVPQEEDSRFGKGHGEHIFLNGIVIQCNLCVIFKDTHEHTAVGQSLTLNMVFPLYAIQPNNDKAGIGYALFFFSTILVQEMFVGREDNNLLLKT